MSDAVGISRKVVVVFGILHLFFSLFGLYVVLVTVRSVTFLHDEPSAPLVVEFFYGMIAINVLLMTALGIAGYRLLRLGIGAMAFSNAVLFAEVAYVFLLPVLWLPTSLRSSIASVTGVGNVGIAVQGIVLYPIISLILMRTSANKAVCDVREV